LEGSRSLPQHICFMITGKELVEAPEKIIEATRWCVEVSETIRNKRGKGGEPHEEGGVKGITFHISTGDPGEIAPCYPLSGGSHGMHD